MVEKLDLPCVTLMVADLRLDFMGGDRPAQLRGARSIDRAGRTSHRSPDAARIPVDPALRDGIRRGPRRIGRSNAKQLEASHRPQALGELPIIEPAPVPFLPRADYCVEDDCKRDQQLERRLLEPQVWSHESGETQA